MNEPRLSPIQQEVLRFLDEEPAVLNVEDCGGTICIPARPGIERHVTLSLRTYGALLDRGLVVRAVPDDARRSPNHDHPLVQRLLRGTTVRD